MKIKDIKAELTLERHGDWYCLIMDGWNLVRTFCRKDFEQITGIKMRLRESREVQSN